MSLENIFINMTDLSIKLGEKFNSFNVYTKSMADKEIVKIY